MVSMNEGVIVNMRGCQGHYDQVGNIIPELFVPICDKAALLEIKFTGDGKYHPTPTVAFREVIRFYPVVEGENFPPILFPQFHNIDGGSLGRYAGSRFPPLM